MEVKQPVKGGKEDRITTRKEERKPFGGKDKEGKKRTTKAAAKEKEVCMGLPVETEVLRTVGSVLRLCILSRS